MVKVFTLGLSSIKTAPVPASGAMAADADLAQLGYTNQNSATLTMETPEKSEFFAEEVDDPVLISQKAGAITLEFDLMNPAPETLVTLMGGTASKSDVSLTDNDTWSAPDTVPNIELSIRVTPKQGFAFDIPRASIAATINGNFTTSELTLVHVVATAMTPTGSSAAKKLILKKLATS